MSGVSSSVVAWIVSVRAESQRSGKLTNFRGGMEVKLATGGGSLENRGSRWSRLSKTKDDSFGRRSELVPLVPSLVVKFFIEFTRELWLRGPSSFRPHDQEVASMYVDIKLSIFRDLLGQMYIAGSLGMHRRRCVFPIVLLRSNVEKVKVVREGALFDGYELLRCGLNGEKMRLFFDRILKKSLEDVVLEWLVLMDRAVLVVEAYLVHPVKEELVMSVGPRFIVELETSQTREQCSLVDSCFNESLSVIL